MTRHLVELSVATGLPFDVLAALPLDVLGVYVDVVNARSR